MKDTPTNILSHLCATLNISPFMKNTLPKKCSYEYFSKRILPNCRELGDRRSRPAHRPRPSLRMYENNILICFSIRLLKMSPSIHQIGGIVWPVFWCNVLSWIIVYLCICNGVKSVGKVSSEHLSRLISVGKVPFCQSRK